MNQYRTFVDGFATLLREGEFLPLGGLTPLRRPFVPPDAPRVLLFSPHPDDEVIVGGLPLRLLREARMNVINVAVTQGSNKARQSERWTELAACCGHLGFGFLQSREGGLEGIVPTGRVDDPARWAGGVKRIAQILETEQPRIIFFPHADDWNRTHIGTHHLVADALASAGDRFSCFTVETEFWGPMDDPNLMVESSSQDVADLLAALSFHAGEVRRNPYHIRLPAWLIDNVRRGGELVGGQGGAPPPFNFATLYRVRRWKEGRFERVLSGGRFLAASEAPSSLFGLFGEIR